jgi:hypothetical protein
LDSSFLVTQYVLDFRTLIDKISRPNALINIAIGDNSRKYMELSTRGLTILPNNNPSLNHNRFNDLSKSGFKALTIPNITAQKNKKIAMLIEFK